MFVHNHTLAQAPQQYSRIPVSADAALQVLRSLWPESTQRSQVPVTWSCSSGCTQTPMHTHMHTVPQPGKQVKMEFNEKPGPNTDTRYRAWPDRSILFRSAESTRGNGYKLEKNEYCICTQENTSLPWGRANTGTGCTESYGVSLHEVG